MKRTTTYKAAALLAVFLLLGLGLAGTARAYTNVSVSLGFHDSLAPYGSWVNVANYGNVWRPSVSAGWRPYTQGHWVYTDYGPTWVGYEPWSDVAYHYGHWVYSNIYGWIWAPGYEWSPARVVWSYGNDYIGWRPDFPAGYASYAGVDSNLWTFIPANRFGYSNYSGYALRPDNVRSLFARRAVRISSAPLRRAELERITRIPIRTVAMREKIIDADRHRVRMLIPASEERRVMEHISRIARTDKELKKPIEAKKALVENKDRRHIDNNKLIDVKKSKGTVKITHPKESKIVPKKIHTITPKAPVRKPVVEPTRSSSHQQHHSKVATYSKSSQKAHFQSRKPTSTLSRHPKHGNMQMNRSTSVTRNPHATSYRIHATVNHPDRGSARFQPRASHPQQQRQRHKPH